MATLVFTREHLVNGKKYERGDAVPVDELSPMRLRQLIGIRRIAEQEDPTPPAPQQRRLPEPKEVAPEAPVLNALVDEAFQKALFPQGERRRGGK